MFHASKWPWMLESDDEGDWHVLKDARYGYVSDACVEGNADEWRAIANALRLGESVSFKRCAVCWVDATTFSLYSPRNTMGRGAQLSGHAKASELADIIDAALTQPTTEPKP
jgi:hypothetical protein